jgi:hypothetical protein
MRTAVASLLLVITAAACGGSNDGPTDGSVELRFIVPPGVRSSPSLVDPLIGDIYGNIFLEEEVTISGPVEGATEFGSVGMFGVDLEAATESAPFTTNPIPPGSYIFLGFFDLDGNGMVDYNPDDGDPVTLPIDAFEIVAGQTIQFVVDFDLVL